MRFASLGSGSEGNALVVETGTGHTLTRVLVDCGFGIREATRRLARLGLGGADLHAVFVTHEHGDHVAGVPALARKHRLPVFMTLGTARACHGDAIPEHVVLVAPDEPLELRGLSITPFTVPHDAREPVQYVLADDRHRLGVLTDLGHATALLPRVLTGLDALVLEANHDPELLSVGPYPPSLKRRIAGGWGHLSNEDAAALLARLDRARLQAVAAAHLSKQNNLRELAQQALAEVLKLPAGEVRVADQDEGLGWVTLEG